MNHRQVKKASTRGGSLGLVLLIGVLVASLAPTVARAETTDSATTGFLECSASAVQVRDVAEPVETGAEGEQCTDDRVSIVPETSFSAGGFTVTTQDAFATTEVIEGHEATASSGVAEFSLERPTALPGILRVRVAYSTASVTCRGGAPELDGSSKVLSVTVDGKELLQTPVNQEMELRLPPVWGDSGRLYLNESEESQVSDEGELVQRAVRYERTGPETRNWFLAESRVGYSGGNPCATGTRVLSVADAAPVAEGTPGVPGHTQGLARFRLSLSEAATTAMSIGYKTANGTATGSDYQTTTGTAIFAFGESFKEVVVPVTMDNSSAEGTENFFLDVVPTSVPAGVVLSDGRGEATILNDDPASSATLSAGDVTVIEGGEGGTTTQAVFTVSLWPPSAGPVKVRAVTADGTAHPPPHDSNDYVTFDTVLNFAPHETTKQVAVTVNNDNVDERDETFFLSLEEAVGALPEKRRGVGIIVNDDGLPTMSIDDQSVQEGDLDQTGVPVTRGVARFTVSLSAPSFREIKVSYATIDGTARSTNSGVFGPADYRSVSGELVFAPGQTTKIVEVNIIPDNIPERQEHFFVQLANNSNSILVKRSGVGEIQIGD